MARSITNNGAKANKLRIAYRTPRGVMLQGHAEALLRSRTTRGYRGKVQLIFTSPPFPLNHKKRYGNQQGEEYIRWLASLAPVFRDLLKPNGSVVLELGNAWEPGKPVMSTLALSVLSADICPTNMHRRLHGGLAECVNL